MKKVILILFVFVQLNLYSQTCLENGIDFYSQSQIDEFVLNYPDCKKIEGPVFIAESSPITSLLGLSQITAFGNKVDIFFTSSLETLEGLESVHTIEGSLFIWSNTMLKNLDALQSLTSVGGFLGITSNDSLESITGLYSLDSIGDGLGIYENSSLTSLNGLDQLTYISNYIEIDNNENLNDISAIKNIDPYSITQKIEITDNPLLSICSNQLICEFMSISPDSLIIHDNGEGCNSLSEIHSNCDTTSVNNIESEEDIVIYPSPTNRYLAFKTPLDNRIIEISIYDMTGKKVYITTSNDNTIDVSFLNEGVFVLELVSERSPVVRKLFVKK